MWQIYLVVRDVDLLHHFFGSISVLAEAAGRRNKSASSLDSVQRLRMHANISTMHHNTLEKLKSDPGTGKSAVEGRHIPCCNVDGGLCGGAAAYGLLSSLF